MFSCICFKIRASKKFKQKKIRWDNIKRNLIKPENIKKYLKFNNLEENQFSNIKNLEKLNNFRINVYKIEKENNSNKYNIFLVQKGNKKVDCYEHPTRVTAETRQSTPGANHQLKPEDGGLPLQTSRHNGYQDP